MNQLPAQILSLLSALSEQLQLPLPGLDAQLRLEPEIRKRFRFSNANSQPPRESAVLLLLFPNENDIHLVFTKRNEYEGVHSGQVAFPGGRTEENDRNAIDTALRETFEEIGVPTNDVQVLGQLTPLFIPPSNYNVQPIVGWIPYLPQFKLDPQEVSLVFTSSLNELIQAQLMQKKTITLYDGSSFEVPCYFIDNQIVWGATSMMLSEFIEVLISMD